MTLHVRPMATSRRTSRRGCRRTASPWPPSATACDTGCCSVGSGVNLRGSFVGACGGGDTQHATVLSPVTQPAITYGVGAGLGGGPVVLLLSGSVYMSWQQVRCRPPHHRRTQVQ